LITQRFQMVSYSAKAIDAEAALLDLGYANFRQLRVSALKLPLAKLPGSATVSIEQTV